MVHAVAGPGGDLPAGLPSQVCPGARATVGLNGLVAGLREAEAVAEARALVAQGFRTLKVKVARR